jgi:hypothetical protein
LGRHQATRVKISQGLEGEAEQEEEMAMGANYYWLYYCPIPLLAFPHIHTTKTNREEISTSSEQNTQSQRRF